MATEKRGKSAEKSTWSETRRVRDRNGQDKVVVYSEVSMTVNVYESNFLKVTFGHERFSPSDKESDLSKTETAAFKFNEKAVDRHARRIKRLMERIREAD